MSVKLRFKFPLSLLTQEADTILTAAEAHGAQINARLPAGFITDQRTLVTTVQDGATSPETGAAATGELTASQNEALRALNELVGQAKDSAKRAFKDHDVKLRSAFQVGINDPKDLASVLQRARIVRDSCALAENATALATKGWVGADTTALTAAIDALDNTDDTQESSKLQKSGATDTRNTAANELYEGLLTIQNAADIQWPERVTANVNVRAEFRLGEFPPKQERKKATPVPTPTPAPPS
jgi:hypothetical protein